MKYFKDRKIYEKCSVGDTVWIKYWYDNDIITPVRIVGKSGRKFVVSHDIKESQLRNAPEETIFPKDIVRKISKEERILD